MAPSRKERKIPDHLEHAMGILANPAGPSSENSDLWKWAKLVVERHNAGESIANAGDWLGSLMVGIDPEYLD